MSLRDWMADDEHTITATEMDSDDVDGRVLLLYDKANEHAWYQTTHYVGDVEDRC